MEREKEIARFTKELAHELTEELACQFVESLLRQIGSAGDWIGKGSWLYYQVARKLYGPLLVECVRWIYQQRRRLGNPPIFFALRDAEPIAVAAEALGFELTKAYLNRPLFVIEDELTEESEAEVGKRLENLLPFYLQQIGLLGNKAVVLADSGCWGTMVRALKEGFMEDKKLYPLFWYSHNPRIPAYLNQLAGGRVPDKVLETVNDSLECVFPKLVKRPTRLVRNPSQGVKLALEPTPTLSRIWGRVALTGVVEAARSYSGQGDPFEMLKRLWELSEEAKQTGRFTGVLPKNTPTWSEGTTFLASWPNNLLP